MTPTTAAPRTTRPVTGGVGDTGSGGDPVTRVLPHGSSSGQSRRCSQGDAARTGWTWGWACGRNREPDKDGDMGTSLRARCTWLSHPDGGMATVGCWGSRLCPGDGGTP